MASHRNSRHTAFATNTSASLAERAAERSVINNSRTSPYDEPVRLRNACDPCHQLKRKCSGDMPCENCTLSNSTESCLYRPVNRLGRPRGSRNRQKTSSRSGPNSKQQQQQQQQEQQRQHQKLSTPEQHGIATTSTTDPMSFSLEGMEQSTSDDMTWDCLLDEDLLTFSSSTNTDMAIDALLSTNINTQHTGPCSDSTKSSYSTVSNTMLETLSHDRQSQQQRSYRQESPQWEQSSSAPVNDCSGSSPEGHGRLHSHNKKARQRNDSLSPPCQCAQGLRTLLTTLGQSSPSASSGSHTQHGSERPLYPIDAVLSNAARAIEQWSALGRCHCCYSTSGEAQIENTFLLAFLSVQCVLGQLRSLTLNSDAAAADACVRVGSFDVTGHRRTTILNMLRTALTQDIESAVEALRCKINDPYAMIDSRSSALLDQIDVMFQDILLDIQTLQQQIR
jgi:hypothetical protein